MPEKRPDIYLFNPTCEYAVANGHSSWQPNQLLQKMEMDLGTLPGYLAHRRDIVLVKETPGAPFINYLHERGFESPRFVLLRDALDGTPPLQELGRLMPWGWSPATHRLLEPLKPRCSNEFQQSPVAKWAPAQREIYSKKFALEIHKILRSQLPEGTILPAGKLPRVCSNRPQIENLLRKWGKLMVKAPWSSSGRGLQPVTKTPVVEKVWDKITGIIKDQGYVMVEPMLDKVMDVALQFEVKNQKVTFLGVSRFLTDKKGQYQGNFLRNTKENIPPEARPIFHLLPDWARNSISKAIENSILARQYEGFFGIDVLIYREITGKIRVNPCLEINVRQNMGLLALHLEKQLASQSEGIFKTLYLPERSFSAFQKDMEKRYPLRMEKNKILSGFVALTPMQEKTRFGAYLLAQPGE